MTQLKALGRSGPCLPLASPSRFWLHFFHTPGAPIGRWRAVPGTELRMGTWRASAWDARRRGSPPPYAAGRRGGPCPRDFWMLAKPVVAVAGDTVVHTRTP